VFCFTRVTTSFPFVLYWQKIAYIAYFPNKQGIRNAKVFTD
jgi:hypothetical protein